MLSVLCFVPREGFDIDGVQAVEYAVFYVGICLFKLAYELLGLLALVVYVAVFLGDSARALYEFQPVVLRPFYDVVLVHAVHRADKLHSLVVFAFQLRYHSLQLRAVEHRHNRRFDNVRKMVPQRNFVAPQLLRLFVEVTAPHPRAEVAGVFFCLVRDFKNVGFKNGDRNPEQLGVALNPFAVFGIVPGVHYKENQLKRKLGVFL